MEVTSSVSQVRTTLSLSPVVLASLIRFISLVGVSWLGDVEDDVCYTLHDTNTTRNDRFDPTSI